MSQREVLRIRKEVECARADEERAVRDANVVLDELRRNECLYKLQLQQDLQNISLEYLFKESSRPQKTARVF